MKYYLYALVTLLCMACSGGFQTPREEPESALLQELNGIRFGFIPNQITVSTNQSQLTITGACDVGDHSSHFIFWEFSASGLHSGVANNPCRDGRLSFTVPLAGIPLPVGSIQFKGQIFAVTSEGQQTTGPTSYLTVNVKPDATPGPTPTPTPGGSTGGPGFCSDSWVQEYCRRGEAPNRFDVVQLVASRFPDKLARCARKNNEFLKEVVRELRKSDQRWGFNWVRGVEGDWNGDVIGYYHGPGNPVEGSRAVTIVDVVSDCGGSNGISWSPHDHMGSCCDPSGVAWTLAPMNLGP